MQKITAPFIGLMTVVSVYAQTSLTFSAKSGDAELDVSLSEMNANANLDLKLFKSDLSVDFGITVGKIDELLISMQPADVYMCLKVGNLTVKPVNDVVACFKKNKGKGWGVIAKEMGIKPGSKEFHALKADAKAKKGKGNSKDNGNSNGKSNNGKGKKK